MIWSGSCGLVSHHIVMNSVLNVDLVTVGPIKSRNQGDGVVVRRYSSVREAFKASAEHLKSTQLKVEA